MPQIDQNDVALNSESDGRAPSRSRSESSVSRDRPGRSKSLTPSPRREAQRSASRSISPGDERSLGPERSHGRSPMRSRSPSPRAKRQRRSHSRSSESNDRIAEAPVQPSATDTIRIDNFVRPLRIDDVRELVSKFGNVESLTMDKFKTHAIVKYSSRTEAADAYQNLQGISFQPESRKTLSVSYIANDTNAEYMDSKPASDSGKAPGASLELGNGVPPPATNTVTLDHLFKKTVALPPLYWLPKKV